MSSNKVVLCGHSPPEVATAVIGLVHLLHNTEPYEAVGYVAAQTEACLAAMTDQVLDFARMRRAA